MCIIMFVFACALLQVLFVFGIIGVEVFKGAMHHHCSDGQDEALRHDPKAYTLGTADLCNPSSSAEGVCAEGMQCLFYEALPLSSTLSFDNMGAPGCLLHSKRGSAFDPRAAG